MNLDATVFFKQQWTTYRKVVEGNYLNHREAYQALNRFLVEDLNRPFRFLDLACGDAQESVQALSGTQIVHYQGMDLAEEALQLASRNLQNLECTSELEQADFVDEMRHGTARVDIVWIGLSLHHLSTIEKKELIENIHRLMHTDGRFLVYEPTLLGDEVRSDFLNRNMKLVRNNGTGLSAAEYNDVDAHIRAFDFPETLANWQSMGKQSGFLRSRVLYTGPQQVYALICFEK